MDAGVDWRQELEVSDGRQFAAYMRTVRKRTLDVVEKVPIDRSQWRLSPDSMSVVDIILHIASVEQALWGLDMAAGTPGKLREFEKDSMNLSDAIATMANVRKGSSEFWSSLTTTQLEQDILTPTGHSLPLKRWLVLAAEHEIHHRSFIHAYRKIWGLASSPIYGLTLDELRQHLEPKPASDS